MRQDERRAREEQLMCMAAMIASGIASRSGTPHSDAEGVAERSVAIAIAIRAKVEDPR